LTAAQPRADALRAGSLATLTVASATAVALVSRFDNHQATLALYYVAVLVAAVRGGTLAGAMALGLSTLAAAGCLLLPLGERKLDGDALIELGLFAVLASALVALAERRRTRGPLEHPDSLELERLNRLYAALSQINQAIIRTQTRAELFASVCEILVSHGGFRMVWIGWRDPQTQQLVPVSRAGDDTLSCRSRSRPTRCSARCGSCCRSAPDLRGLRLTLALRAS
jgi:K+-sensing histidine kinase KdpD